MENGAFETNLIESDGVPVLIRDNIDEASRELYRLFTKQIAVRASTRSVDIEEDDYKMDYDIENALNILIRHPSLAAEKYRGMFPLGHFVMAVASPEVIIHTIKLHPAALLFCILGASCNLPLHLACAKGYPAAVIKCMAYYYPVAIKVRNSRNETPIQCALGSRTRASNSGAIGALLEIAPSLIQVPGPAFAESPQSTNLLQQAIVRECGRETIHLIAAFYLQQTSTFSVCDGIVSERAASGLGSLITGLNKLSCSPRFWTLTGFSSLMHNLIRASKMGHLCIRLPSFGSMEEDKRARNSFWRALLRNESIQQLEIRFPTYNDTGGPRRTRHTNWLTTLASSLQVNRRVSSLKLEGLKAKEMALIDFISDGSAPINLKLLFCEVRGGAAPLTLPRAWKRCRVQSLHIAAGIWEGECVLAKELPKVLTKMHSVVFLDVLDGTGVWRGVERQLATILLENPNIKTLGASLPHADIAPIIEALKTNTTLEFCFFGGLFASHSKNLGSLLEVLEHHNTTLVECKDHCAHQRTEEDGKLRYWTNLNRCDRSYARRPDSGVNYIRLLSSVKKLIEIVDSEDELNAIFGLLQASPWIVQVVLDQAQTGPQLGK